MNTRQSAAPNRSRWRAPGSRPGGRLGSRLGALLGAGALLAGAGCGAASSAGTTTTPPGGASPTAATSSTAGHGGAAAVTVRVVASRYGAILADGAGYTLYRFSENRGTVNACTGVCATTWHPLIVPAGARLTGTGALAGLAVATQRGGVEQAVFDGQLLYRFAGDSRPGQTNGEGIGGTWFVVRASGAGSGSASPTASPSSGGGYGGGY